MQQLESGHSERLMQFLYTLRSRGVLDTNVLLAMEKIDRATLY